MLIIMVIWMMMMVYSFQVEEKCEKEAIKKKVEEWKT